MTFWRRLRTYLIGVGLGLGIVYVMFGDRELNTWTPEKRIMTAIDSSEVNLSERAICQLKCLNLENKKWVAIQQVANVNFSESQVQKKPCPIYRLESEVSNGMFTMVWEVCEADEKVEMLSINKAGTSCNC